MTNIICIHENEIPRKRISVCGPMYVDARGIDAQKLSASAIHCTSLWTIGMFFFRMDLNSMDSIKLDAKSLARYIIKYTSIQKYFDARPVNSMHLN